MKNGPRQFSVYFLHETVAIFFFFFSYDQFEKIGRTFESKRKPYVLDISVGCYILSWEVSHLTFKKKKLRFHKNTHNINE